MANQYKRGRQFEYHVKYFFEDLGFHVVRSSGSHTDTDLVAKKDSNTIFIQCKNDKSYIKVKFIKDILEDLIKKNKIFIFNDDFVVFNRKTLIERLNNGIINDKNIESKKIKINKIYNKIKNYLKSNDLLIINIPRRKTWLIISKKL